MTDGPRSSGDPDDIDDIDDLGAAPTRAAGRGSGRTPRSGSPGGPRRVVRGLRRRRLGRVVVVLGLIVLLALVPILLSSLKKTPRNMVGISYGGGPVEAAHFQRVVQPGSGLYFNGLFDPLYLYPSDTQTYIVSKVPGQGTVAESDSIVAPTNDRVQVEYQVAIYFKLNSDRLQTFHEQLGLQYSAYQAGGWRRLIQDTFRQQVENALQEETRKYAVADLFGNADDLAAVQDSVEEKLSTRLVGALGAPLFCGPTFTAGGECGAPTFIIKKLDIPESVASAFEANRTSQIKVQTSENEIAQRAAEAKAIEALNQGLAQAGMPYVLLRAIESGKIDFWVLPSDSGVTLQAPNASGPSEDGSATTTTTVDGG
jgi:regulator of protease activity HflC (stomatin/prohibitin superfamily)